MKKTISIIIALAVCASGLFFTRAESNAALLVPGYADWSVSAGSVSVLNHSRMIESVLFKDYGSFGQQHLMSNIPSGLDCSVVCSISPAAFVNAFSAGDKLEMLCYISEESESNEIEINIGNFSVSKQLEKGKIEALAVSLSDFKHGSVSLDTIKNEFDGNFISVGMTADSGRIDLVFSDIYISDGNFFKGSADYNDVNSQRPNGQLVNFGKRTDFEYYQSGNTVPTVDNGSGFPPLSSFRCAVNGEPTWTSDVTLVKYFSEGALKDYSGINFYINASVSSNVRQYITVKLSSNVKEKPSAARYTFTRDIFFEKDSIRLIDLTFSDMFAGVQDSLLEGDILNGVYALEIHIASYDGSDGNNYSCSYEISDVYGKTDSHKYIPNISVSASVQATEMPTATADNYDIMEVADLYSQLPGSDPDKYNYTDYQNLIKFLNKYRELSDEQRTKLSEEYSITEQKYNELLEMYNSMDPPQNNESKSSEYTQQAADNKDVAADDNVSEKTLIYLFIAVSSAALIAMLLTEKYFLIKRKKSISDQ